MSGWAVIDKKDGKPVAEGLSRDAARARVMRLRSRGREVFAAKTAKRPLAFCVYESRLSRVVTDLLR
jgi:hypothetical protein